MNIILLNVPLLFLFLVNLKHLSTTSLLTSVFKSNNNQHCAKQDSMPFRGTYLQPWLTVSEQIQRACAVVVHVQCVHPSFYSLTNPLKVSSSPWTLSLLHIPALNHLSFSLQKSAFFFSRSEHVKFGGSFSLVPVTLFCCPPAPFVPHTHTLTFLSNVVEGDQAPPCCVTVPELIFLCEYRHLSACLRVSSLYVILGFWLLRRLFL